jgi:succinate-semialdehyde dehydrogenase/glutarate-semialdehyde dehydrogenase
MKLLGDKVRALRVGVETDHDVDVGAITTKRQLDTIKRHVEEAVEKGATIFAESNCPTDTAGFFHPCVVLTDVDHDMLVMREETFGPVLGVMKVDDMDEAIELANDSNLGLTGSVWSRDTRKAEALARRIRAGAITINDHLMSHGMAETPWGGFYESGIGRTHGDIGFQEMTEPQVIVHDWLPGVKKNFWWHPHGPDIYEGLRGALHLLYGKGTGRKLAGMNKLLKVFPRTFSR